MRQRKRTRLHILCIICMITTILFTHPTSAIKAMATTKLNKTNIVLAKGQSKTLKLTGSKKSPKWSSKNKRIATVTRSGKYSAKIKAKKKGTTYIYATLNNKTLRCKIKVENPAINKKTLTLQTGKTYRLIIKNTKQSITYKSSNKKVATVSKTGIITAHSIGTAKITATLTCGKKYTCSVTVSESGNTNQTDCAASAETAAYDAGEYSIGTVHTGDGTYYDGGYIGGCCNLDAISSDYYVAAINKIDYRAGNLAGAYLKVTGPNGSINVLITDTLADGEGKKGDIDLNKEAFAKIEPLVTGRMTVTWEIIPLPTDKPIQYVYKPTSTQYWMEVQVRNHRYPVKKLEMKNSSGTYVELERQEYNFFRMDNPGAGPYTFRVTDIYGHVMVDTNVPLSPNKAVAGKANFPY